MSLEVLVPLFQRYRPFIEVIKYKPEDFISNIKTGFIYYIDNGQVALHYINLMA